MRNYIKLDLTPLCNFDEKMILDSRKQFFFKWCCVK